MIKILVLLNRITVFHFYFLDKRLKRDLTKEEMEESLGDLSLLLNPRKRESSEDSSCKVSRDLSNLRSMACQLLTGFSAIINYVNSSQET